MTTPKPLRVFCSYSHKDETYLNELRTWLRRLERQGLIEWWHDREISPGWEWEEAIDKNLRSADIILLLVTPDFMGSDYIFEKEIDRAVERHERAEARVIPIIVRPADWEGASLDRLQALPKDAKPITTWLNRDEAWLDVARGIRKAVEDLFVERQKRATKERYRNAVKEVWADNKISGMEAERLDTLTSELGLAMDTSADIEREVMGESKEAILVRQEQAAKEEEQRERLKGLYDRALELYQRERWQAVVDVFTQIHSEDADYPDTEGLYESAHEALEAQKRARRLATLYREGQQHMDAQEWHKALERFEEVQYLEAGYRDTEWLLSWVRRELAGGTRGNGEQVSQAEAGSNLVQQIEQEAMQSAEDFYAQSIGSLKSQIQNYRQQLEQYEEQLSEDDAQAQVQEMIDYYYELEGSIDQTAEEQGIHDPVNEAAESAQQAQDATDQANATLAAQKKAQELGVNLNQVQGTGAEGRITVKDVISAADMQEVQQQSQEQRYLLARDFFGQSMGRIKGQMQSDSAQLQNLTQQLPADTQALLQRMPDSYSQFVDTIDQAARDVGVQDSLEESARQAKQNADAAR